MNLQLVAVLFAGAAFGSTIPISGHGQFWLDNEYESNMFVAFSGSNGTDSASFGGYLPAGYLQPTYVDASSLRWMPLQDYSATIDGVSSHFWSWSLGDGGGALTIFDDSGNVLNTVDLLGTIQTTSYREYGTRFFPSGQFNIGWYAVGTFDIVPLDSLIADPLAIPEAGSGILLGLGLAVLFYIKKSASASRAFGRIRPGNPPSSPTV